MRRAAKRKSVIKKVRKSKFPFLPFVFVLIAITGVIVYLVINNSPAKIPKAATPLNSVDQVIATRGNNLLPHDINLPSPMVDWAWGRHATESTKFKQPSSGSVAPWLVMYRDATTINTPNNARLNVRRIALWNYQPSNSQWVKLYDGLPQWMVNINLDFSGGFEDLTPKIEADGSYSFAIPTGKVIHMASGPWPSIFEGNGILAVVEARLLGSAADIVAAKAGMDAGADYRQAGGAFSGYSTPGYYESGFGHFGLLTGEWKAFDMLSSTLTDSQFRANHPPGLDTVTVASPTPTPTPTPPQATTVPILNSFKADYFNNQTFTGTPAYSTNTTSINYNWGTGSPAAGVNADHFSAKYTGSFSFDGSTYKFNATSDDGVRVYLDGQLIIDAWKDQAPTTYSVSKMPTAGNHTVTVEYYENGFGATLSVNWAKVSPITGSKPPPCGIYGDVNADGVISEEDAVMVLNGYFKIITLTADQKIRADVNKNNLITAGDATLIRKYLNGSLAKFSVCP